MRAAIILVTMIILAGCQQNFDDQYDEVEAQLKADAERLDQDMAKETAREPEATP
ncbi:MAG: hypothetical protein HC788_03425 [Sphingopyxis sp.]|nr:hypothetical protein [Sphingopyxis sp.]